MSEWVGIDVDGDGYAETVAYDTDLDGLVDTADLDSNLDGRIEEHIAALPQGGFAHDLDLNGNGLVDSTAYDFNADGLFDRIDVDPNEDGYYSTADSYYPDGAVVPAQEVLDGGLPGYSGPWDPTGIATEANNQMVEVWIDPPLDSDNDGLSNGPDLDD